MAKETVEQIIELASTDPEFYRQLDTAVAATRAANLAQERLLEQYDLTAEERGAILDRDIKKFAEMGIARRILQRADWCTGE